MLRMAETRKTDIKAVQSPATSARASMPVLMAKGMASY